MIFKTVRLARSHVVLTDYECTVPTLWLYAMLYTQSDSLSLTTCGLLPCCMLCRHVRGCKFVHLLCISLYELL